MKIIVTFEDHEQDFLRWEIEDGTVVSCRPFQEKIWKGTRVLNKEIQPGDQLEIELNGEACTLKYPVETVELVQ